MIAIYVIVGIIVITALAGVFKSHQCEICKKVLSAKEAPLKGELDGIEYMCLCKRCLDRIEDAKSSEAFNRAHGRGGI